MQRIATLLAQHVAGVWPPCCDVATSRVLLAQFESGQIFHATFVDVA